MRLLTAAASLFAAISLSAAAEGTALTYDPELRGPAPVPAAERGLPTVIAEPYFQVSDKALQLEGPVFDRGGNLYFVEVFGGSVFKLTPDKRLSTILGPSERASAGLAIHKDGRIFIAGLGNFKNTGSIVAINPDGSGLKTIVGPDKGFSIDDLIFDSQGGLYFTDFKGSSTQPAGGLYYLSPDFATITPIDPGLGIANGVGLSPNGKRVYVTESAKGLLHTIDLLDAMTIAPFGEGVAHKFSGPLPDSLRVDGDGNVWVAMYGQGRFLVFNRNGFPIGQVLLPGRDDGHFLRSTSLAFKPGTNDVYLVSNDWDGDPVQGSMIFHCRGFAKALPLYSER